MPIRVLLIWPNSRNEVLGWGDLGAIAEPLALEYLGAALAMDGHVCKILDMRLHKSALNDTVRTFQPDVVAITAFSMHVSRAREIAARVKGLRRGVRTILGGHHATFMPQDFFVPAVDYVVAGEGCDLIRDVARAVDNGTQPDPRPGLHIRQPDNRFTGEGRAAPGAEEWGDALLPDRNLTEADRGRYFIDAMRPIALMRTTAGCPYRCTFCSIWKALDGRYYMRDIDRVVAEIAQIAEPNIFLVDDEAFINKRRMLALAEAIRVAGLKKSFFTYCRIDTLIRNREAIEAWHAIGLKRLFIGIDAIAETDLDAYNKSCSVSQIEAGIAIAREIGVEIFAQFVVDPQATPRQFRTLVRFIEHHRLEYPSFTVLTPLPGTDIYDPAQIIRVQADGRPDWDLFDCQNAVTQTRLPAEDFRHEYRNLYKVFKGSYTQYREHNTRIHELDAAEALHSGHPTSAVRLTTANTEGSVL